MFNGSRVTSEPSPIFPEHLPPLGSVKKTDEPEFANARITIVDDEPANVLLLERVLGDVGYSHIESTTNPLDALERCTQHPPDLLLLDLMMPRLDGYELLKRLRAEWGTEPVAVLVLTADASRDACRRALQGGANDFLAKPFDRTEILLRARNLLESCLLQKRLKAANADLEARVQTRTQELLDANLLLEIAQLEALEKLAQAAEFRDDDTGEHTQRVGAVTALLARQLGMSAHDVEIIRRAAPLHDVGKIAVPDAILLKPGKLTDEEFAVMKNHAAVGAELLSHSNSPLMQRAEMIARSHHEKWDGSGYPNRLVGENIPLEGRLLAVVDVFDALTHERPYKRAWPVEKALDEIKSGAGRHFDPAVVEAFLQLPVEMLV